MSQDAIDARRYRWLREQRCCPFSELDDAWDTPEALDAAIDAEMELRYAITEAGRKLLKEWK